MSKESMSDWLRDLRAHYPDLQLFAPASRELIDSLRSEVGQIPEDLESLLLCSNGLECRRFRLLSAFDEHQPKKTWESVQKLQKETIGGHEDLAKRFLVFADIGNGFAMIDRDSGHIWYQEEGDDLMSETSLSLVEFVEMSVRETE